MSSFLCYIMLCYVMLCYVTTTAIVVVVSCAYSPSEDRDIGSGPKHNI